MTWPNKKEETPMQLCQYYKYRDKLVIEKNIVYKGERVVIPELIRKKIWKNFISVILE